MSVGEITPKKQLFTRPTDFFDSLKDRQLTVFLFFTYISIAIIVAVATDKIIHIITPLPSVVNGEGFCDKASSP